MPQPHASARRRGVRVARILPVAVASLLISLFAIAPAAQADPATGPGAAQRPPASDASGAWAILTGGPSGPGGPGTAGGLLAVLAIVATGLAWVVLRRRGTDSDRRR